MKEKPFANMLNGAVRFILGVGQGRGWALGEVFNVTRFEG